MTPCCTCTYATLGNRITGKSTDLSAVNRFFQTPPIPEKKGLIPVVKMTSVLSLTKIHNVCISDRLPLNSRNFEFCENKNKIYIIPLTEPGEAVDEQSEVKKSRETVPLTLTTFPPPYL